MSVPIIDGTQSILYFLQKQPWAFQPAASDEPTGWRSSPLPPGVTIDATTGLVSGAATLPGVYIFDLWAHNDDGESLPTRFYAGIEASSAAALGDIAVKFDLVSGEVSLDAPPPLAGAPAAGEAASGGGVDLSTITDKKAYRAAALAQAICRTKAGSDLVLQVRPVKGGATMPLPLVKLRLTLKELDTDAVIQSSDTFLTSGSGVDAVNRVHMLLTAAALQGALSNYGSSRGTQFPARAELEMEWTNPDAATNSTDPGDSVKFGGATLRAASEAFFIAVAAPQQPLA